jgi:hypothetical protein
LPSRITQNIKNKYSTEDTLNDLLDPSRVKTRRQNEANRAAVYAGMVGKDSFAVDDSWMTRKIDIY